MLDIDCVIPNIVRRLLSNKTLPKKFATCSLQEVGVVFLTTQILSIMRKTNCSKTLFFITRGRESFRYQLCDYYKKKRRQFDEDFRTLLKALKIALVEKYPFKKGARIQGEHCFEYEADDIISFYKKKNPKHYVIASMDKDVLYSNSGSHFNLKTETFFNVSKREAQFFAYYQCIVGDKGDNIRGVKGVGEINYRDFLNEQAKEHELWEQTIQAFKIKENLSDVEAKEKALLNMRLVNMHQMTHHGAIKLWEPKFKPQRAFFYKRVRLQNPNFKKSS
ncbi:5'-3' exonuclease [Helicobacter cetorum]|uniref:5'-3' exonuclease n=1 Tax=Helicobacter cetorum (strain ATCC BAA-540 / CCUG 52418 / MIT 99-5656) TaxID=1163745 RepID=I0ETE8_HELCM|nr:5'-3' exonuclease [Helicobacter cetorum MIT 99-5656]